VQPASVGLADLLDPCQRLGLAVANVVADIRNMREVDTGKRCDGAFHLFVHGLSSALYSSASSFFPEIFCKSPSTSEYTIAGTSPKRSRRSSLSSRGSS